MERDFDEYHVPIVLYILLQRALAIYTLSPVIRIKNLVERWTSTVKPFGEMHTVYIHSFILRLIFIAFKLDGKLFAAVTFTTRLWIQWDDKKRKIKLLFPSAPYRPASTNAIKMHKPD
jgi:hypothetical protein